MAGWVLPFPSLSRLHLLIKLLEEIPIEGTDCIIHFCYIELLYSGRNNGPGNWNLLVCCWISHCHRIPEICSPLSLLLSIFLKDTQDVVIKLNIVLGTERHKDFFFLLKSFQCRGDIYAFPYILTRVGSVTFRCHKEQNETVRISSQNFKACTWKKKFVKGIMLIV